MKLASLKTNLLIKEIKSESLNMDASESSNNKMVFKINIDL